MYKRFSALPLCLAAACLLLGQGTAVGQAQTTGTTGTTGATTTAGTTASVQQTTGAIAVEPPKQEVPPQTGAPNSQKPVRPFFGYTFFAPGRALYDARRQANQATGGTNQLVDPSVSVTIPERYQLGPGDVLTIRYWSRTRQPQESSIKVDSRGQVAVPVTGQLVTLRGLSVGEAEALLNRYLANGLKNAQLTLELKQLRSFTVALLGDAYAPGNYEVPSTATLLNLLYYTGGPIETGSLRKIEIIRSGGKSLAVDFYSYLLTGAGKYDVPLQPGDKVFIPPVGPRVTVTGEAYRQEVFELKEGEKVRDVIRFAGGVKPSGIAQRVAVQSTRPGVAKVLVDVDLTKADQNPIVHDGDVVDVYSIRSNLANAVTVTGNVDQPGKYEATPGLTAQGLIDKARGLLPDTYLERADLFRLDADGRKSLIRIDLRAKDGPSAARSIPILANDELKIYSVADVQYVGSRQIEIAGSVRTPGMYPRARGMRVLDALVSAGGLERNAYGAEAHLFRTNPDGTAGPMVKLNLSKIFLGDAAENVELQDLDRLRVYNAEEMLFTLEQIVEIEGAVQRPARYRLTQGMRLADLISVAGGLLPGAFKDYAFYRKANLPNGAPGNLVKLDLNRVLAGEVSQNVVLGPQDRVLVLSQQEAGFVPKATVEIIGAVQKPQVYDRGEGMTLRDLLQLSGNILPTAYTDRVYLQRTNADGTIGPLLTLKYEEIMSGSAQANLTLQDRDRITVFTREQAQFAKPQLVQIRGAVLRPGEYQRAENMTLLDLIRLAGGTMPDASETIEVARGYVPEGTPIDQVRLSDVLAGRGSTPLRDGDIVTIPALSSFVENPSTVTVQGRVEKPGTYAIATSRVRLSDVIKRAGGPARQSFLAGASIARRPQYLSTPAQQQLAPQLAEMIKKVNDDEYQRALAKANVDKLRVTANVNSGGVQIPATGIATTPPVTPTIVPDALSQTQLVTKARPLDPTDLAPPGNISVDFEGALRRPGSSEDPLLMDGDVIFIPLEPSTVSVTGAVILPASVFFSAGKPLSYYVSNAGGLTDDAADKFYVIKATGKLLRADSRTRIDKGDIIFIPTKVMSANLTDRQAQIDNVVKNVTNAGIIYGIIRALAK